MEMRTRLTLAPGQNGTKKLLHKYGERLVCVRYRYDEESRRRFKTVELVIEEMSWERAPDPLVAIRVEAHELELRGQVKSAGARWNAVRKVWELQLSAVRRLRLQRRLV